jgi:hypothetical protein
MALPVLALKIGLIKILLVFFRIIYNNIPLSVPLRYTTPPPNPLSLFTLPCHSEGAAATVRIPIVYLIQSMGLPRFSRNDKRGQNLPRIKYGASF